MPIKMHRLDEDRIEELFWKFDTERKRTGMERDAFKSAMRQFAVYSLDHAGVPCDIEIP
jgi:hypothetical protein